MPKSVKPSRQAFWLSHLQRAQAERISVRAYARRELLIRSRCSTKLKCWRPNQPKTKRLKTFHPQSLQPLPNRVASVRRCRST